MPNSPNDNSNLIIDNCHFDSFTTSAYVYTTNIVHGVGMLTIRDVRNIDIIDSTLENCISYNDRYHCKKFF